MIVRQNSGKWVKNPVSGRWRREFVPLKKPLGNGYIAGTNRGTGYRIEGKLWTKINSKNNQPYLQGVFCGSHAGGKGLRVSILPNVLKDKASVHDYELILNFGGAEYMDGLLACLWLRKYKDSDDTYLIGRFGEYMILVITRNKHATEANGEPAFYIKLKPLKVIKVGKANPKDKEEFEKRFEVEREMFRDPKFEVPYDHVCKYGA